MDDNRMAAIIASTVATGLRTAEQQGCVPVAAVFVVATETELGVQGGIISAYGEPDDFEREVSGPVLDFFERRLNRMLVRLGKAEPLETTVNQGLPIEVAGDLLAVRSLIDRTEDAEARAAWMRVQRYLAGLVEPEASNVTAKQEVLS